VRILRGRLTHVGECLLDRFVECLDLPVDGHRAGCVEQPNKVERSRCEGSTRTICHHDFLRRVTGNVDWEEIGAARLERDSPHATSGTLLGGCAVVVMRSPDVSGNADDVSAALRSEMSAPRRRTTSAARGLTERALASSWTSRPWAPGAGSAWGR